MILKEAGISILTSEEKVTIEIEDMGSITKFVKVTMTPEQFTQALSRLSNTKCSVEVRGLHKVGKRHEHKEFTFEVPSGLGFGRDRDKRFLPILMRKCPEGWEPDTHFGSQNSFFSEGTKNYARTIIRRWVDSEE